MGPGEQYPDAHRIATELWREKMEALDLDASDADTSSPNYERYESEKAKVVPPYDADKFVDKWRKMAPDEPARTLTAHLGKDSYTHIHYDDDQARTISVREAARLQSFPDGFRVRGRHERGVPADRERGPPPPRARARAPRRGRDRGGGPRPVPRGGRRLACP